jgi:hypothetical protein
VIGTPLPLTSSNDAERPYGIGHHAVYQPSGVASIDENSVRVSYSPRPEPKNSPTGASTVDLPSNVARSRAPSSTASDAVTCAGSACRRYTREPSQLWLRIVYPCAFSSPSWPGPRSSTSVRVHESPRRECTS